ncbi:MAG: hypothetical protein HYY18_06050 [Planctomycetes bacterium]|nr:hypothetical protein [Planctomycetota bacterium]
MSLPRRFAAQIRFLPAFCLAFLLSAPLARAEDRPATEEEARAFVPQVEKGNWWIVAERRGGATPAEALLFFMVADATPAQASILVVATSGWSLVLVVDRESWNVTQVTPAWTTWDKDAGRFKVAADKPFAARVERPGLVEFRGYPTLDLVWHASPLPGADTLLRLSESAAKKTEAETRPLAGELTVDAGGRLVVARRTDDGAELRQTWEKGLPFPRTATWISGASSDPVTASLLRFGRSAPQLMSAGEGKFGLHLMSWPSTTLPCYRIEHRFVPAVEAIRLAAEVLAPGTPPVEVTVEAESWWRAGDVVHVQWEIHALPAAREAPARPPSNRQKIPQSGEFYMECPGTWRVGEEDYVFLFGWGRDAAANAWEVPQTFQAVDADENLVRMMTRSDLDAFSNPDYWNGDTPRWDRPGFLSDHPPRPARAPSRRPTRWLLALRRHDLTAAALFRFRLGPERQIEDFAGVDAPLPAGPVGLRRREPLLRPQDWLLQRAATGVRTAASGKVLSLFQEEGGVRIEVMTEEACVSKRIKNDQFFAALSALIERRRDKKEATLALTREDVIKLENGEEEADLSEELRRLEKKIPRRAPHVFRSTEGPGRRVYQGYDFTFPWWRETFVFDDGEGYVAHLRLAGPTDRTPDPGRPERERPLWVDRPTPTTKSK